MTPLSHPDGRLRDVVRDIKLGLQTLGPHIQVHRSVMERWLEALLAASPGPVAGAVRDVDFENQHRQLEALGLLGEFAPSCDIADALGSALLEARAKVAGAVPAPDLRAEIAAYEQFVAAVRIPASGPQTINNITRALSDLAIALDPPRSEQDETP